MASIGSESLPVAIIAYARRENVERMFKTLVECGVKRIYIYFDGSTQESIQKWRNECIMELRRIASIEQVHLHILERKNNWGPAVSVIKALDDFFSHEDFGLILEDDLIFDCSLVTYIYSLRDVLDSNPDFWMLSASNLVCESNSTLLTNYPQTWGWSTTKDKWREIKASIIDDSEYAFPLWSLSRRFYWSVGRSRSLNGIIDAWDIPVAYQMYRSNKFSVLPPTNLITNIGNDSYATHTKNLDEGLRKSVGEIPSDFEKWPDLSLVNSINRKLEKKIFKIRPWHMFSGLKALLFDNRKLRKKSSLALRLIDFESKEFEA